MLQLTDRQTGQPISINPQQVSAIIAARPNDGDGCALLMAGGFELVVTESVEEVTTRVQKVLNAY